MEPADDITRLISEWQSGNRAAEEALFDKLYQRMHTIADHLVRHERANRTLGPTALVHEAYVRLCGSVETKIVDRTHFLALSARVMRRILVDRARARQADKRAGEMQSLEDNISWFRTDADLDEVIAVDRALDVLSQQSPRQCRLVELRYFGGYTIEESAAVLHISARHARREWDVARTRLREAIDGTSESDKEL
jgi:RNA polymerase sigma-70 factor, ECF subfamily